jgi:hypothetical protein
MHVLGPGTPAQGASYDPSNPWFASYWNPDWAHNADDEQEFSWIYSFDRETSRNSAPRNIITNMYAELRNADPANCSIVLATAAGSSCEVYNNGR